MHFGVAAALKVEDAGIRPAVLIVANESAAGVPALSVVFAGSGEAEEEGHVAFLADVGRAVHGEDAPIRSDGSSSQ